MKTRDLIRFLCLFALAGTASSAEETARLKEAAAQIDALVTAHLQVLDREANRPATDEEFLRRTYLAIAGRIPTANETRAFLPDKSPDKRADLIDDLLKSDGYVSHFYNYWADILRAKSRLPGIRGAAGDPYIKYIKESLRENKPYDKWVAEMLTSVGDTWQEGAGATGFYRRDRGMPLDHMALTMQTFLGTQMACAQCHDHPFDEWTQMDFFQTAAFTNMPNQFQRGGSTMSGKDGGPDFRRVQFYFRRQFDGGTPDPNLQQVAQIMRDTLGFGIPDAGTGVVRLPRDYQYEDAKPGTPVTAKTPFGETVTHGQTPQKTGFFRKRKAPATPQTNKNSREVFADWLVSEENPRFTKVIANRLWKKVMGVGLIEPADDLNKDTVAAIPPLMEHLEKEMVRLDYDMKAFLRLLYNTETYQRAATTEDLDPAEPYHFAGPVMQRLTAEQLWDSMLTLKLEDVDAYKNPYDRGLYEAYGRLSRMDTQELIKEVEALMASAEGRRLSSNQIYAKFNASVSPMTGAQAEMDTALDILTKGMDTEQLKVFYERAPEMKRLWDQAGKARASGELEKSREYFQQAQAIREELGIDMKQLQEVSRAKRQSRERDRGQNEFVRASEMPSPAPPGHFLRQFGSSDREAIENSSLDATTPQALQLLNGFVDNRLLSSPDTQVYKLLREKETNTERIHHLYLSIWNRYPREKEVNFLLDYVHKTKDGQVWKEVIWSMLNSHEFRFVL